MKIDRDVAVIVCAGPSLDALPAQAWRKVADAGAVVAVNGAIAAAACADVAFTYASAMDATTGLIDKVPRFAELWASTRAWRLGMAGAEHAPADTYIREVDERDGVDGWSDDEAAGYAGGSSAMVTANWLCNRWRDDVALLPPRGFRRVAFLGLDMNPGDGRHARGAGAHTSGFALSAERHATVSEGWRKLCAEAGRRGIEIVNLTPGTGLETMPRRSLA